MKKSILLVDDNVNAMSELRNYLKACYEYEVVGEACDGIEALRMLHMLQPDLLILDLVMPKMDGFSVLKNAAGKGTKIIILSALSSESFVTKAIEMGADYYCIKPMSLGGVKDCIDSVLSIESNVSPKKNLGNMNDLDFNDRIMRIFVSVGIPASIRGYHFLRVAVRKVMTDPTLIASLTKRLYPEIAEFFYTSPSKVERAMRHAIDVAWSRGTIINLNSLFGMNIYQKNEKPSSGQFIALIADKMLLDLAKNKNAIQ